MQAEFSNMAVGSVSGTLRKYTSTSRHRKGKKGRKPGTRNTTYLEEVVSRTDRRWTAGNSDARSERVAFDGNDYVFKFNLRRTGRNKDDIRRVSFYR